MAFQCGRRRERKKKREREIKKERERERKKEKRKKEKKERKKKYGKAAKGQALRECDRINCCGASVSPLAWSRVVTTVQSYEGSHAVLTHCTDMRLPVGNVAFQNGPTSNTS